jgi:hypothetical protein
LIHITGRHLLVDADSVLDFDQIAFGLTQLDQTLFGVPVLDGEDAADARLSAHSARRHQHRSIRVRQKDPHGGELPGFNAPLLFSISASTVRVRELGVTLGETRAM